MKNYPKPPDDQKGYKIHDFLLTSSQNLHTYIQIPTSHLNKHGQMAELVMAPG